MRFVVFDGTRLGTVDGGVVTDVTPLVAESTSPAGPLQALLDAGGAGALSEDRLAALPTRALAEVDVGAPLPRPGKVIGAPVNYLDHQAEMSYSTSIADLGVFLKASSSVIGHGGTVQLPYSDVRTDHEGELAVVVGRTARDVPAESALDHVFGYACGLDMTVRSTEDRSTRKSFETFTPLGPVVVTTDELADPGRLELTCRVNGEVRQRCSTADLIFGVPELVAYVSSVMTLWPGDVILTGTPAGVGAVHDGDVVEVEISGIGTLSVGVSAAGAVEYARRPGAAHAPTAAHGG